MLIFGIEPPDRLGHPFSCRLTCRFLIAALDDCVARFQNVVNRFGPPIRFASVFSPSQSWSSVRAYFAPGRALSSWLRFDRSAAEFDVIARAGV
jgi:hypothetical protein